ncbi:DUF4340 domain-containing protein [Coleofasciculus sp. F4-SAH-05]|uniref:DUF4340 domain-containing protein n=1 Tax=Coleofasciculus sp. F4-SAH-05 TaxID=3069525 RepID=UPI0032F373FB
MKLQKTTWVLLIVALFLGGFVYFYEIVGTPQREAAKEAEKQLFSFEEDEIQRVNIYIQEESRKFERVSEPEPGWRMTEPKDVPASDPSVAFLLNLLVEGKSDRIIPNVSPETLKEYGLDQPQAMVTVRLKNDETHEILLGKPDFNNSFLYAQVDSFSDKSQRSNVFLVPMDFEYAVNRPLSEWEQTKEETPEETEPSDTENEESTSETEPTTEETEPATEETDPSENQATPNNSETEPATEETDPSENQATPNNSDTETEESTSEPTPTPANQSPSASPSPEKPSSSEEKKQSIEDETASPNEETESENPPNDSEEEDSPSE